jgi:hypothetical protein
MAIKVAVWLNGKLSDGELPTTTNFLKMAVSRAGTPMLGGVRNEI